jgi:hypothetical protein
MFQQLGFFGTFSIILMGCLLIKATGGGGVDIELDLRKLLFRLKFWGKAEKMQELIKIKDKSSE